MDRITTKQILGVIDATTDIDSLAPLTQNRTVASLPFAGRYRLIDFMLSNMVHAGIDSVGVFSHPHHNSLKEHIGSGKVWDLDRKNGGLFFFTQRGEEKFGTKMGVQRSMDFFLSSPYKYVLVAKCNIVGRIPILKVLKRHVETGADITEVSYQGKGLGVHIIERELLLKLFKEYEKTSYETIFDFAFAPEAGLVIGQYEATGRLMIVDSLECYYENSMSLLNFENWKHIYTKKYPVYTKVKDQPPTQYLPGSHVSNAIIANGCEIHGEVENSILSRNVQIGKNSIVRNSIIMPRTKIGDNCILDGVIVDKNVDIANGTHLEGTPESPVVVPKGATIEGELVSQ